MPPPTEQPKPRGRLTLAVAGGLAALVAGLGIAGVLMMGDPDGKSPPAASEGGLVIDASGGEGRIDPGKPLRCFVQGQYVGETSLSDCARRNGVATDALDVGLDETGALAAAEQAGQVLTPLPPSAEDAAEPQESAAQPDAGESPVADAAAGPAGACWRRDGGRWRKLPGDIELNACVQTLFAGRCEAAGGATYGRWGSQTLRLITGRVEISDDNRSFRSLMRQSADCSFQPLG